jgi:hypothetical protein
MKAAIKYICYMAMMTFGHLASAQGLVAVQNNAFADFKTEQPLAFTVTAGGGYDTLNYKADTLIVQDIASWYAQLGVGASYTDVDPTTPWSFSLQTSAINYVDGVPRFGNNFYNASGSFNLEHRFSERLKISNNLLFTYGVDPGNSSSFTARPPRFGTDSTSTATTTSTSATPGRHDSPPRPPTLLMASAIRMMPSRRLKIATRTFCPAVLLCHLEAHQPCGRVPLPHDHLLQHAGQELHLTLRTWRG